MEDRVELIEECIKAVMEKTGVNSIKTNIFNITIAKARESVFVTNQNKIPDEFLDVKTVFSPMKKEIYKAIKKGIEVPGAKLILGEKSLRIR